MIAVVVAAAAWVMMAPIVWKDPHFFEISQMIRSLQNDCGGSLLVPVMSGQ